jgi:hypothetical protein
MPYTDAYEAIKSVPTERDGTAEDSHDTEENLYGSATREISRW